MKNTTKPPTGINGVEYGPKTLAAARLLARDFAGLIAYSRRHGWVTRSDQSEPWTMKAAEAIMTRQAIAALRLAGCAGPTPRARVRSVLNAARQLPEMAAPPAAELEHLTPRR